MQSLSRILAAGALAGALVAPVASPAIAHETTYPHHHTYKGHTHYAKKYCRRSPATTGTVVGGVTGAVVGGKVLGGGILGVAAGAVGGAVAGGAVDRSMTAHYRCYYK